MRHAKRSQRLSRPHDQRQALLRHLVSSLIAHDQIRTTWHRAKEAQRLADRLVTFGKAGGVHARQRALRVLQDRGLVKRLFSDVAPRFVDRRGGYTRVVRLGFRRGDGAEEALLTFSQIPDAPPTVSGVPKPSPESRAPLPTTEPGAPRAEAQKPSKKFFEGLRSLWPRKQH